jgi:hypothetical protein
MQAKKSIRISLSIFVISIGSLVTNHLASRAADIAPNIKASPSVAPPSADSPITPFTENSKILPIVNRSTGFDPDGKIIVQSVEPTVPEKSPEPTSLPPTAAPVKKSPLKDNPFRLFGWETAQPIGKDQSLIQFGGNSFNNPNDFRGGTGSQINRSNDAYLDFVYGVGNDTQLSVSLSGKDDTIFANLVRPNSQLQILNNTIPVQAKWRFYNQGRVQGAVVAGAEFPAPFGALFFRPNRSIEYSQPAATGGGKDSIFAPNNSVVLGIGFPVSYQATDNLSLHLNPRLSIFPRNLAVTTTVGDPNAIRNAGIGFDGQSLDYFGTVAGIGVGVNYALSPNLQVAADYTQIVVGKNSIGQANNGSLLSTQPVWNAGVKYTPNDRTALGLYVTNRFSASSASPANLLAQPGNDFGFGLNVTYLPDFASDFPGEFRKSYPSKSAFWNTAAGFPSTTLPGNSIMYQLGIGSQGQVNPSIRLGLTDDLEVAVTHNNTSRREMPIETSLFGRWAVLPDQGQPGFSAAFGLGLTKIDGQGLDIAYSVYSDVPISYRLSGNGLTLHATPKLVLPAQFQGVSTMLALSLGATWQVTDSTQVFGGITPSLSGANQLVAGKTLSMSGSTPVYNLGIRQLFPNGNSTYGVELYYTNGAGNSGFQSVSALPNGDSQFGVRFSLLNGTPTR